MHVPKLNQNLGKLIKNYTENECGIIKIKTLSSTKKIHIKKINNITEIQKKKKLGKGAYFLGLNLNTGE